MPAVPSKLERELAAVRGRIGPKAKGKKPRESRAIKPCINYYAPIPREHIDDYMVGRIRGMNEAGIPGKYIAETVGVSESTVSRWIRRDWNLLPSNMKKNKKKLKINLRRILEENKDKQEKQKKLILQN